MPLVGFILIAMGLFAVGGTLFMVTREKVEHEEWYIPPQTSDTSASAPAVTPPAQPGTTSVPMPVPSAPESVQDAADANKTE
jgi:hypothetical protein